jgi:hypothetical protein
MGCKIVRSESMRALPSSVMRDAGNSRYLHTIPHQSITVRAPILSLLPAVPYRRSCAAPNTTVPDVRRNSSIAAVEAEAAAAAEAGADLASEAAAEEEEAEGLASIVRGWNVPRVAATIVSADGVEADGDGRGTGTGTTGSVEADAGVEAEPEVEAGAGGMVVG